MSPGYGSPAPDTILAPLVGRAATMRSVALGFSSGAESPQLPAGWSSRGSNFIGVDGGLVPRPGLSHVSDYTTLGVIDGPTWVGEVSTTTGEYWPVVLSARTPAYANAATLVWSRMSQIAGGSHSVAANPIQAVAPSTGAPNRFDAVQYYHPVSDEFELCFCCSGGSGPWTFRANNAPLFSTLSNAPQAKCVTVFDNRLIFSNVSSQGTGYPQRVQWSARGDPETYTAPDGGAEDLLDAQGVITRVLGTDDRLLVFFDGEIWQGLRAPFPYNFQFIRLDPSIGCFAPRTVATTPRGVVFLGQDFNLYLVPPGGSPQAIGNNVQRYLREDIESSAFTTFDGVPVSGHYDERRGGYLLVYNATGGVQSSRGVFVSLRDGSFNPIGWDGENQQITALGETHAVATSGDRKRQRILLTSVVTVSVGQAGSGARVLEWDSTSSRDPAMPVNSWGSFSTVTASRLLLVPNPNPRVAQTLTEVRVDYRATSAASLTVRASADLGTTFPASTAIALPAAPLSAQTLVALTPVTAPYPAIELLHASSQTAFVIQGITAWVTEAGGG